MAEMERGRELVQKYLDGLASDAETAELDQMLARRPEIARDFAVAARCDSYLDDYFKGEGAVAGVEALRQREAAGPMRAEPAGRPPLHRTRAGAWLKYALAPLAAAAVLLLVIRLFSVGPVQSAPGAAVADLHGEVVLVRATGITPAAAGDRLAGGEGLRTAAGSSATLSYRDGTTLQLSGNTSISITGTDTRPDQAKRLDLAAGDLAADVVRQPAGAPMTVTTPNAEAVVVGTRFTLLVAPGYTRLEVNEGTVRLTRTQDGASVEVGAGQHSVVAAGTRLAPHAVEAPVAEGAPGPHTQVAGTVLVACPQGKYIKIKTEGGPNLDFFSVAGKARELVKGLKRHERVKLTCFRCPKSGATVVVKVERLSR